MNRETQKKHVETVQLSAELLQHVMSFFISDDTTMIDGTTLRSASRVNKTWKNVIEMKELWRPKKAVQCHCTKSNNSDHNDDLDKKNKSTNQPTNICVKPAVRRPSIHRSLRIKEKCGDGRCEETTTTLPTLMGFVNEKRITNGPEKLTFQVRQRSTGQRWILSISENGEHSESLLRELYRGHLELEDDFLSSNTDHNTTSICGVTYWGGRVVRWYRPIVDNYVRKEIHMPSNRNKKCINKYLRQEQQQWNNTHTISQLRRPPPSIWAVLVDWMAQICECFDLSYETMALATYIFDKYIVSSTSWSRFRRFSQLVLGTSINLSCKTQNSTGFPIFTQRDVIFCADVIFSEDDVLMMERDILHHLGWKLAIPTPLDFIDIFLSSHVRQHPTYPSKVRSMCIYISELILQTDISLRCRPSLIAAATIILAQFVLRDEFINDTTPFLWSEELERTTSVCFSEITQLVISITRAINQIQTAYPELTVINLRHKKEHRHEVAKTSVPVLSSTTALQQYKQQTRL